MADGFMVVDEYPMGYGYDSAYESSTQGQCLDVAAINVSANQALVDVEYSWSGSKEEAKTDIGADLTGDIDLGVISGDLEASYDGTFNDTNATEALTIAVKVRSVVATLGTNFEPDPQRCDPENNMSFAGFLQNCGDRFVSRKEMGGYIFLVAGKSDISSDEKHDISGDLDVDFGIGQVDLSGLATIVNDLTVQGFDVRMSIFGFPELIGQFDAQPGETVQSPGDVFDFLESDMIDEWEAEAEDDIWPGTTYGAVIDQTMTPYEEPFYQSCTGSEDGEVLWCYTNFFTQTQSYVPAYERWVTIIDTRLNNQSEYYWGNTTAKAQDNKDQHTDTGDVISSCLRRISDRVAECRRTGGDTSAGENDICTACNPDTIYHCDDDDEDGLCDGSGATSEKCSWRNLGDLYDALPDVVPTHDATDYGVELISTDQHEPSFDIYPHSTHVCVLGGASGKMSGGGETAKVFRNGTQWRFQASSQQGDDDGETLRSRAYCSLISNFFDNSNSSWTTHPDLVASTSGGAVTEDFVDSSNNTLDDKYATALNGMSGKFQGGGEYAEVVRHTQPMMLKVGTQQTSVTGYGSSFGLDAPVGGTIERGARTEYSVGTNSDASDAYVDELMIPTDDGICYFKNIAGDFDGGGEGVRILKKDGSWYLRAYAACKDHAGWFGTGACEDRKNVTATASCYLYDQTN
jgi:hypothetical protein